MIIKDEIGEHKVIEQKNGITVKILQKPSEDYKKKLEKRAKKINEIKQKKEEQQRMDKLIQDRMRDIAIRELKKEGKL